MELIMGEHLETKESFFRLIEGRICRAFYQDDTTRERTVWLPIDDEYLLLARLQILDRDFGEALRDLMEDYLNNYAELQQLLQVMELKENPSQVLVRAVQDVEE